MESNKDSMIDKAEARDSSNDVDVRLLDTILASKSLKDDKGLETDRKCVV